MKGVCLSCVTRYVSKFIRALVYMRQLMQGLNEIVYAS